MKKIIIFIITVVLILFLINYYIIYKTNKEIKLINDIEDEEFDCVLVLGAGIRNKKPSPMLEDRLLTAIEIYNSG